MPRTSRNASSIEIPSTSGVVSSKTAKSALLAAVYSDMRGGTTIASGQSRRACLPAHRRADAVRLRLVARGQNDTAADDHRLPAQARVVPLLDRREERVRVGVQDRRRHEHMFAKNRFPGNQRLEPFPPCAAGRAG